MMNNNITQSEFQLRYSEQRRFLDLFEPNRRSYVTKLFCYAVRSGYTAPTSIIASVKNNAQGRYADIPQMIDEHRPAAEDFANYILHWESLTFGEKRAIKEGKGTVYREMYLSKQPPTDKQINCLRALDYKGEVTNKWEASQLIDKLMK